MAINDAQTPPPLAVGSDPAHVSTPVRVGLAISGALLGAMIGGLVASLVAKCLGGGG